MCRRCWLLCPSKQLRCLSFVTDLWRSVQPCWHAIHYSQTISTFPSFFLLLLDVLICIIKMCNTNVAFLSYGRCSFLILLIHVYLFCLGFSKDYFLTFLLCPWYSQYSSQERYFCCFCGFAEIYHFKKWVRSITVETIQRLELVALVPKIRTLHVGSKSVLDDVLTPDVITSSGRDMQWDGPLSDRWPGSWCALRECKAVATLFEIAVAFTTSVSLKEAQFHGYDGSLDAWSRMASDRRIYMTNGSYSGL